MRIHSRGYGGPAAGNRLGLSFALAPCSYRTRIQQSVQCTRTDAMRRKPPGDAPVVPQR